MAERGKAIETVKQVGDLILADAQITAYQREGTFLLITLRDWQEKPHQIRFNIVASVEDYFCLNTDLNHLEISRPADQPDGMSSKYYQFISAWDEIVLLAVKAETVVYT